MTSKKDQETIRLIVRELVSSEVLLRHHLGAFDDFVSVDIPAFFKENRDYVLIEDHILRLSNPVLNRPSLGEYNGVLRAVSAQECKQRGLTYSGHLMVDVELIRTVEGVEQVLCKKQSIYFGSIPILTGSALDTTTDAVTGYFVVRGTEKTVVNAEQLGFNQLFTTLNKEPERCTTTTSVYSERKGYRFLNTLTYAVKEIVLEKFTTRGGMVTFSAQPISTQFVLTDLLKYLGFQLSTCLQYLALPSVQRALVQLSLVNIDAVPRDVVADRLSCQISKHEVLEKRLERLDYIVDNYLLTHLNDTADSRRAKGQYMLNMLIRAIRVYTGTEQASFLDQVGYKRMKTLRELMHQIFAFYALRSLKLAGQKFVRINSYKHLKLVQLFKPQIVTTGIFNALISNNWVGNKTELVQKLDRSSVFATVASLRRIKSPLNASQQHISARLVDTTQRGRIDPLDAPAGPNIGLVKSMALGAAISLPVDKSVVSKLIELAASMPGPFPVIHENSVLAKVADVGRCLELFKSHRGQLPLDVSFSGKDDQVHVRTDPGRLLRPLLVIKEGRIGKASSFKKMLKTRTIQYLDVEEQKNAVVSESLDQLPSTTTHCEISPFLNFGMGTGCIPYFNTISANRGTGAQRMFRQAISTDASAGLLTLLTHQRPLIRTPLQELLEQTVIHGEQHGLNLNTALMTYYGRYMEDTLGVKRQVLERGAFMAEIKTPYSLKTSGLEDDVSNQFVSPASYVKSPRQAPAYDALEDDGLPAVGSVIKPGMVVIGKISLGGQSSSFTGAVYEDSSVYYVGSADLHVKSVAIDRQPDGTWYAKVVLYRIQQPMEADKFVTRYGQKAVMGIPFDQRDGPIAEGGRAPDVIMNPHSYPSRYAFGHLTEMCATKCLLKGEPRPLSLLEPGHFSTEEAYAFLERKGAKNSTERFFDGSTGLGLKNQIYTGFSFFMALHHLALEKLQVRSVGPRQLLTRLPVEGRARKGGLRLGEMERDALLSHGAAALVQERFGVDRTRTLFCVSCRVPLSPNARDVTRCHLCNSASHLAFVDISYVLCLLVRELECMHIRVDFELTEPTHTLGRVGRPTATLKSLHFSVFTEQQIVRRSIGPITSARTYDEAGVPVKGGLLDQALGAARINMICGTCGGTSRTCMGHLAHLKMPRPVFHVGFMPQLKELFGSVCLNCMRIRCTCGSQMRDQKVKLVKPTFLLVQGKELDAIESYRLLCMVPDEDLPGHNLKVRPENLMINNLLVPSTLIRLSLYLDRNRKAQDDLTTKLVDIAKVCEKLQKDIDQENLPTIIKGEHNLLQYLVSTYLNNNLPNVPVSLHRKGHPLVSVADRINGKQGRLRHTISGKRVDYAARAVAMPDSSLGLDEVGVPECIARELTTVELITQQNFVQITRRLDRWPQYPSLLSLITETGELKVIKEKIQQIRTLMAPGMYVRTHLTTGTPVLLNRQPTLHKGGILGYRCIVKPYRGLGVHPSSTHHFHLDFDGDELNLHCPQGPVVAKELEGLVGLCNNVLDFKKGLPMIGVNQDSLTGLYLLTASDRTYSSKEIGLLLKGARVRRWPESMTGRAAISVVLPQGLNLSMKEGENELVIRDGNLVKGTLNSKYLSPSVGSMLVLASRILTPRVFMSMVEDLAIVGRNATLLEGLSYARHQNCWTGQKLRRMLTLKHDVTDLKALRTALDALILETPGSAVTMALAGASGSLLNIVQNVAFVGQLPRTYGRNEHAFGPGRSHAVQCDPAVRSGLVKTGYSSGLSPTEHFEHAISTRESGIATTIKTSVGGYQFRKIMASMQELVIDASGAVVTPSGKIIQPRYAGTGIDHRRLSTEAPFVDLGRGYAHLDQAAEAKAEELLHVLERSELQLPTLFLRAVSRYATAHGLSLEQLLSHDLRTVLDDYLIPIGQPVGLLTAACIGQPVNQMLLDSKHTTSKAGQSIDSGLNRYCELLSGTKNPTMASVTVVNPEPSFLVEILPLSLRNFFTMQLDYDKFLAELRTTEALLLRRHYNFGILTQAVDQCATWAKASMKVTNYTIVLRTDDSLSFAHLMRGLLSYRLGTLRTRQYHKTTTGQGDVYEFSSGKAYRSFLMNKSRCSRLTTTDLKRIERFHGIVYAKLALMACLHQVLNARGLNIHPNHFLLASDVMTFEGTLLGLNRNGVMKTKQSVLARAGFETASSVLLKSAAEGHVDVLKGNYEAMMAGTMIHSGTNVTDVYLEPQ